MKKSILCCLVSVWVVIISVLTPLSVQAATVVNDVNFNTIINSSGAHNIKQRFTGIKTGNKLRTSFKTPVTFSDDKEILLL